MELKCPSCSAPLWAPSGQASLPDYKPGEPLNSDPRTLRQAPADCPTCGTALPFRAAEGLEAATARWLPREPAPGKAEQPPKPFPSALAEPLPTPGYPDQVETRSRFTAEVQAKHAQLLAGRPTPELLTTTPPGPPAQNQADHRDPLGASSPAQPTPAAVGLPDPAQAPELSTNLPPPKLGSPRPATAKKQPAEEQREAEGLLS